MSDSDNRVTLEISIGPVQGFVAQARRTRDLWAGSFLLAYLAGWAMRGAREGGGELTRPAQAVLDADPLFQWIDGKREGPPPRIGTLPNHFVVGCASEQAARQAAASARQAFEKAWQRVADAVWDRYVDSVKAAGQNVDAIWDRQTKGFWEFLWAVAPENEAKGLLARRKHWRTHQQPEEPGDKCQIIADLQELSGHTGYAAREGQKEFWTELRTKGNLGSLEIEEKERLCSIAVIKRLLPKVSKRALGWKLDADHWPSTDYIAGVPWLRRATALAPDEAKDYAERVLQVGESCVVRHRLSYCGLGDHPIVTLSPDWYDLSALDNRNSTKLRNENEATRAELRAAARMLFRTPVIEQGKTSDLGPPSSYYAVLLADGDKMGKLAEALSEKSGTKSLSECLAQFSKSAIAAVERYDGVVVYAGGDDLLAFLPLDSAPACADELARTFTDSFPKTTPATLSAAVVFAHIRAPLRTVLDRAHKLLDDVAKDVNGRNSLVAAVFGRAAEQARWVSCWERGGGRAVQQLAALKTHLSKGRADVDVGLSSSLIYRLREIFVRLLDARWDPGREISLPAELEPEPLILAEVAHSLSKRSDPGSRDRVRQLTEALRAVTPLVRGGGKAPEDRVSLDAWFLAQFLAGGGREAEHQ